MRAPAGRGSGQGVVTLGETMALLAAERVGPLRHVPSMSVGMGGAESNVAVALRRLGTPVTWIGRVGADSFGEVRAVTDPAAATGLMVKERRTSRSLSVW
ncbi:PfkB family carbohydrate kinase [Streptomyces sp. LZ34]